MAHTIGQKISNSMKHMHEAMNEKITTTWKHSHSHSRSVKSNESVPYATDKINDGYHSNWQMGRLEHIHTGSMRFLSIYNVYICVHSVHSHWICTHFIHTITKCVCVCIKCTYAERASHHITSHHTPTPTQTQMATITDKRMRIPRLSCAQRSSYTYTVFIFFRTVRICISFNSMLSVRLFMHLSPCSCVRVNGMVRFSFNFIACSWNFPMRIFYAM